MYRVAFCLGCDGAMVGITMRSSSSSQEPSLWPVLRCERKLESGLQEGPQQDGWRMPLLYKVSTLPAYVLLCCPPSHTWDVTLPPAFYRKIVSLCFAASWPSIWGSQIAQTKQKTRQIPISLPHHFPLQSSASLQCRLKWQLFIY